MPASVGLYAQDINRRQLLFINLIDISTSIEDEIFQIEIFVSEGCMRAWNTRRLVKSSALVHKKFG